MTLDEYNAFCAGLARTSHVVQWGGAHLWKLGKSAKSVGKVFAIAGWGGGADLAVTFKCSAMSYDLLAGQPGLRPAPYLASRAMTWIQRVSPESMDDVTLKGYLKESHRLVCLSLSKRVRRELGLNEA
jgi:predicted DNA-binding protein (MmcQ/YjbR family)